MKVSVLLNRLKGLHPYSILRFGLGDPMSKKEDFCFSLTGATSVAVQIERIEPLLDYLSPDTNCVFLNNKGEESELKIWFSMQQADACRVCGSLETVRNVSQYLSTDDRYCDCILICCASCGEDLKLEM